MEIVGYLPTIRGLAHSMCAPFFWYTVHGNDQDRVLHNGTVCLLRLEGKLIGVSAAHVYRQYIADRETHRHIKCQFGSVSVSPEELIVDISDELDVATFLLPEVIAAATGVRAHVPVSWPPNPVEFGQVLVYGGYPGVLRVERQLEIDIPFQSFIGKVLSVSRSDLKMHLDLGNFHQPLVGAISPNTDLGGMSGGPVFRLVTRPIERYELVGFIYEFQANLELVMARVANCVATDGSLDHAAW